ncbi:hypothetical protein HN371_16070 [Candidatus Poribacteria bacterium]|jgi:hypothetical protein|nr:hypothetical protein [Candidatus Poribacteria bacterium]MBT5534235.1 hypothetical protein [Candidatus Poribacteria bacterium]MBT7807257.1 hypothetical protein [Candidatus Poribacteria bacterium]
MPAAGRPASPTMARRPVRWRAVTIAVLLLPVNAYWIALVEMIWHGFHFSATSIPLNVVFIVFVLALVNMAIRRVAPAAALSQQEFVLIYVVLASTTAVIAHDSMVSLMGLFTHAFWFATPENEWRQILHPLLPRWLVMDREEIIAPFYEGGGSFLHPKVLRYWIGPVLAWALIASLTYILVLLVNSLLRKRWVDQEKLPYPIVQLPLDLTNPRAALLRSRPMWIAFSFAAGVEIINGINHFYPNFPHVPIREHTADMGLWVTEAPWNAIGVTYVHVRLFLLGLCYLLPLDVSFSTAVFYWVRKGQFVAGAATGMSTIPYYPFQPHQALGAVVAICGISMWGGRGHWRAVSARVLGSGSRDVDNGEPIRYRAATVGIIACLVALYFISSQAGMSGGVFVAFFALYLVIAVAVTRMRAELGPPVHDMSGVNPQTALTTIVGTRPLGPRNLTVFALFSWLNGSNRSHPMPHQLEALKLSQRAGLNPSRTTALMAAVIAPAVLIAFIVYLSALYRYSASVALDPPGQVMAPAVGTYNALASSVQFPRPPDVNGCVAIGGGPAFTLFLGVMRTRFLWWPCTPWDTPSASTAGHSTTSGS